MPVLENATLNYVKIKYPGKKYESNDTQWSVDACISEAQAKEWNKMFRQQKAKEYTNEEYKRAFRATEVPFPNQDEQYVVKIKQDTHYNGAPREFGAVRVLDSSGNDITEEHLVGNGSKGAVAYRIADWKDKQFAKLVAVRVDDLVHYEDKGNPLTELLSGGGGASAKKSAPAKKSAARGSSDPFSDENIPF